MMLAYRRLIVVDVRVSEGGGGVHQQHGRLYKTHRSFSTLYIHTFYIHVSIYIFIIYIYYYYYTYFSIHIYTF